MEDAMKGIAGSSWRQPWKPEHIWFVGGVWFGCVVGLWLGIVGFGMVF